MKNQASRSYILKIYLMIFDIFLIFENFIFYIICLEVF